MRAHAHHAGQYIVQFRALSGSPARDRQIKQTSALKRPRSKLMRAVQLVQVYHKSVVEAEAEDDEEVLMAATLQVTSPLVKLVDACAELPETLDKLQNMLLPVMEDMCRRKNVDAIEPVRCSVSLLLERSFDKNTSGTPQTVFRTRRLLRAQTARTFRW